jgi:hypothetical protein
MTAAVVVVERLRFEDQEIRLPWYGSVDLPLKQETSAQEPTSTTSFTG